MKTRQKSLWLSGISLATCIAMLAGTTFAWFSDTATSNGNVITSGTLDIEVTAQDLTSAGEDDTATYTVGDYELVVDTTKDSVDLATSTAPLIQETNWEPGQVNAKLITIENKGSLATRIGMNAVVHDKELQDALWFDFVTIVDGTVQGSLTARPMNTLNELFEIAEANYTNEFVNGVYTLKPTADGEGADLAQFILFYGMNKSAGNEYQEKNYSADIQVIATQATYEADGLGNDQYDVEAYADIRTVGTEKEFTDLVELVNNGTDNLTIVLTDDITVTNAIAFTKLANIDLNGYTLTCPSFSMENADSTETVGIAGGTIVATTGDITVLVPSGSVNIANATIATDGKVTFNATTNTLTLSGTTTFTKKDMSTEVTPVIMDNTRVVVATTTDIKITVEDTATSVTVEDGGSDNDETTSGTITVIVPEGASVNIVNSNETSSDILTDGDGTVQFDGETIDGTKITTAEELKTFLTSGNDTEGYLANSFTYDLDSDELGTMSVTTEKSLNLNNKTITIEHDITNDDTSGTMADSNSAYPIKLAEAVKFTLYNGTFIAGTENDQGAMGAITFGDQNKNATLYVHDMTFHNAYQGYPCIQAYYMEEVTIEDCTFYSYDCVAVKSDNSEVTINNCVVYQDGASTYNSNLFAAQGGVGTSTVTNGVLTSYETNSTLNINSGTYTSTGDGLSVYNTGGIINVYGGTFTADEDVLTVSPPTGYTYPTGINVYDGTFNGKISSLDSSNIYGFINLMGGTFKNTELTLAEFSAYVPSGYKAVETTTGVYTIKEVQVIATVTNGEGVSENYYNLADVFTNSSNIVTPITITLKSDVAEEITYAAGKTIILDLAGHDLELTGESSITNNWGVFTIQDSIGSGTLTISEGATLVNENFMELAYNYLTIENGVKLINHGTITNNSIIRLLSGATIENYGTIANNYLTISVEEHLDYLTDTVVYVLDGEYFYYNNMDTGMNDYWEDSELLIVKDCTITEDCIDDTKNSNFIVQECVTLTITNSSLLNNNNTITLKPNASIINNSGAAITITNSNGDTTSVADGTTYTEN